jgi:hypothetical protein
MASWVLLQSRPSSACCAEADVPDLEVEQWAWDLLSGFQLSNVLSVS